MSDDKITVWESAGARQFAGVLTSIGDAAAMRNFLRDVMTEKEIVEMSSRLEAARLLQEGATYADIVARTKLSSRTVARISDWMQDGCGGYEEVLKQVERPHMPPVRSGRRS